MKIFRWFRNNGLYGFKFNFPAPSSVPQVTWWNITPLAAKYPNMSPYVAFDNNPIIYIDPNGKQVLIATTVKYNEAGDAIFGGFIEYKNGNLFNTNGTEYVGDNEYALKVANHLNSLSEDYLLKERLTDLVESNQIHYITHPNNNPDPDKKGLNLNYPLSEGSITFYDPDNFNAPNEIRDPRDAISHELFGHAWELDQGLTPAGKTDNGIPLFEISATNIENRARVQITGDPIRTSYDKKSIIPYLKLSLYHEAKKSIKENYPSINENTKK